MNAGRIEQQGRPEAVYRHPATAFAARFMGLSNLVGAQVREVGETGVTLDTALGRLCVADRTLAARPGDQVTLVIRPEAARLLGASDPFNLIRGAVVARSFRGSRTRLTVRHASGAELEFELDGAAWQELDEMIALELRVDAMSLIPG
jgi:putative spermidine/putrescine transport system ATP-binding protein